MRNAAVLLLVTLISSFYVATASAQAVEAQPSGSPVSSLSDLYPGWNLVTAEVSGPVEGAFACPVSAVWGWSSEAGWRGYFPREPYPLLSDLGVLQGGQAYWVYCK